MIHAHILGTDDIIDGMDAGMPCTILSWVWLADNLEDAAERVYEDKRSLEHPLSDFFPKSWRELRGSKKEVRFMRPTCIVSLVLVSARGLDG
jgi:hypothetical protein